MLGRSSKKHSQGRSQRYLLGFQPAKNINTLPKFKRSNIVVVHVKKWFQDSFNVFCRGFLCWAGFECTVMGRTLPRAANIHSEPWLGLVSSSQDRTPFMCAQNGITCKPGVLKGRDAPRCQLALAAFHWVSLQKTVTDKNLELEENGVEGIPEDCYS